MHVTCSIYNYYIIIKIWKGNGKRVLNVDSSIPGKLFVETLAFFKSLISFIFQWFTNWVNRSLSSVGNEKELLLLTT